MTTPIRGTINLAGGSNITLSQSGVSVSIIGPGDGSVSMYPLVIPQVITSVPLTQSLSAGAAANSTQSSNTINGWMFPFPNPSAIVANNVRMAAIHSLVSGATSHTGTYQYGATFALYTRSLSTLNSASIWTHSMQFSHASTNTSASGTWIATIAYGRSGANSTSFTVSTSLSANFSVVANVLSGSKLVPFNRTDVPFTIPASQYYGMILQSSQTGGASSHGSLSAQGMLAFTNTNVFYSEIGDATANITTPWPLLGQISFPFTFNTTNSTATVPSISTINVTNITTTVASANTVSFNQIPFVQILTRGD